MYSGNHSPVHPLDTLLEAAVRLEPDPRFCFVFVGGGSEFGRLRGVAEARGLANVKFLPYQPIESLVRVAFRRGFAGRGAGKCDGRDDPSVEALQHPGGGHPVLYVGPERSHISDTMERRC